MANFKCYERNGKQYARFSTVKDLLDKPALIPWAVGQAIEYVKKNYNPAEPLEAVLERAKQNIGRWRLMPLISGRRFTA